MLIKTVNKIFSKRIVYRNPLFVRLCSNLISSYSISKNSNQTTQDKLVVTDLIGDVLQIGINRPNKRNCIDRKTAAALLQAFKDFDENSEARVAVLYGVGGNFCSGYDLQELASIEDPKMIFEENTGPMGPTWYETSKPVIAAIEGFAVGGGFELALWCDMRIADETSLFSFLNRRFGVPLVDGGTARLAPIVGLGRALDMVMTGRNVKGPEALQIGLISHMAACGSAIGRALFVAQTFGRYPQASFLADLRNTRRAFQSSMEEALQRERDAAHQSLKEAKEGAMQFVDGRGRHGSPWFKPKKEEDI